MKREKTQMQKCRTCMLQSQHLIWKKEFLCFERYAKYYLLVLPSSFPSGNYIKECPLLKTM